MEEPIDVATAETAAFLSQHLVPSAELIEIGCGEGDVSLALQQRGYRITGIDLDENTVAHAKNRGVNAIHAAWPRFDSAPVDAITFTRSLHHIDDLRQAVRKARDTLKPRGKLLVEDFAFDAADVATLKWFVSVVQEQTLGADGAHDFLETLVAARDLVAVWRRHHEEHHVHSAEALHRSIAEHFVIDEAFAVPYLYRYLIPALPPTSDAALALQQVVRDEAQRGQAGQITLIGRRVVATPL
jgi:SAM-dependent methyltransferase